MAEDYARAADDMQAAFERAGESIGKSLAKAALEGENAFRRMTANVLADLARIALDQILPQTSSSSGGSAGALTLEALRGLMGAGDARTGAITINMQVHDAPAGELMRSKGQVAQSLAQAVSDGLRRL